jgi:outer membrane protein OmpA-like peptidoglycan-associated protein
MQATGVLLAEHDTGLRGMLTLPEEQYDPAEYEKKEYDVLDANRDKDIALDTVDQCDNTKDGLTVKASGCEKDDAGNVGYPHEDAMLMTPYITTAGYSAPAVATVKKSNISPEESNMGLTLQVMANSQLLTEKARTKLTEFVSKILNRPGATVLIEGYTASDNDTIENMQLSEQRANLVREILIQQGIDESKITAVGKGIENPRAANDTSNGRAMNRRVEITIQ